MKEQIEKAIVSLGKRGQIGPLGMVIPLVLVFGLAVIIAVIMSTVAGQTYSSVAPNLDVNNAAIQLDVNAAVNNGFSAYSQATSQLDLLAIIAVAFVVISAVVMFMKVGNPAGNSGML